MLTSRTPSVTGGFQTRIDHTLELRWRQPLDERCRPSIDGGQVPHQHLGSRRAYGQHFFRTMPVARVGRVGLQPDLLSPWPGEPELVDLEQFGDMVVLHPGEVPGQPADGVRTGTWRPGQLVGVEAGHRVGDDRWNPPVELEQHFGDVHWQSGAQFPTGGTVPYLLSLYTRGFSSPEKLIGTTVETLRQAATVGEGQLPQTISASGWMS